MREGAGPPQVFTMTAGGGDLTSIGLGHAPKWSPEGRSIVIDDGQHILVMHADGSDVHDITPRLVNVFSLDPAWSPDGRWIVFASEPVGTRDAALWLVHPDGSDLHQLVNAPGEEEHPSWSPDSRSVVFDSLPAAGPDHLYTVRIDGSDLDRVSPDALDAWGPSWSTEDVIAFANDSSGATSDIFTMRSDGGGLMRLTHAPQGITMGLPGFSPAESRLRSRASTALSRERISIA
jgi:Tol biopolymer transport system component